MIRKSVQIAAAVAAVALTTGVATGVATAETPGSRPPLAPPTAEIESAAQAYLTAHPRMSREDAIAAAAGQTARKAVYEELYRTSAATFGGAWFDPESGVLHLAATTGDDAARAAALGERHGVRVEPHVVRHSFAALERAAAELRAGRTTLGRAAAGQVGIDVRANRVVANVPAAQRESLAGLADTALVSVAADPRVETEADAGCTTRDACDWTVRAGAMLWRGTAADPDVCSVGFTARDAQGARFVYTAGHCSSGNGVDWGTGAQRIGPMSSSSDSGAVDAAIIQVTNPWFTGDLGGEAYAPWAADRSTPVTGFAPTLGYIWAGETVCLAANYTDPGGPNRCGVVGTNSDANVRGMVRVDGLDACGGDSGGGWYWLASSTRRVAYGLHSRSDRGCMGDDGGDTSWFSAVPTVTATFAPTLTIETRAS